MILWKLSFKWMHAPASTMEDLASCTKSWDTTGSSVYPRIPKRSDSGLVAASLRAAFISSPVHGFTVRTVKSTRDTSGVGTRTDIPVSFPLSSGMTFPTALAAPVEEGIMFDMAERPPRQSFPPLAGPSTTSWVAVAAWMVVISPSSIPKLLWITLARGARQLVVQEALETTFSEEEYFSWLTPITYIGASPEGAEMITFLAPPSRWADAFSTVVKIPVDSQTYSAPESPQAISAGLRSAKNLTRQVPSMTRQSPSTSTVPA
mmetsp:Transcript_12722/g.19076  ORF Transcript_12722/g.19076 Transcript_12722/m.19076 type:complete len:262 (-) Transcript_12722:230-1015(-)